MALLACNFSSALNHLRTLAISASTRYQKLSFNGKATICLLLLFHVCLIVFITLITPSRIAQFMYDLAVDIRRLSYGYFIFMVAIVLISFPPFIGHSTLMNLCGFTYGMLGFIPAAISTVGGSALVFFLLRSLFSDRLRKWTTANEKWGALEAVIRARGLPLIILIRISPFPPWVYSNTLFAGIESVSLAQFVFATLFVLPRIMVYVFVGSRIAGLSDGEQRSHMDTTAKLINISLVLGSIVISVVASSIVYYFVQREIKSLHNSRPTTNGPGAELAHSEEELEEGIPLLALSELST